MGHNIFKKFAKGIFHEKIVNYIEKSCEILKKFL